MVGIQYKPGALAQCSRERFEYGRADLLGRPAALAHQVHMPVFGDRVDRCTRAEMGARDEPETLEQFQVAVDGGDVHPARPAAYLGADLLRSGVFQFGDRVEHELALRSHAQPVAMQRVA